MKKNKDKLPDVKKKPLGFLNKLVKKSVMPLAIIFIMMAVLFSLFRALTPWAKQYKGQVEHHLSVLLGQPVTIHNMETSWYWFEPVLKMDQVTLLDTKDHALKLNKMLIGINIFSSLWHWQIEPGVLFVDDVHLSLRQAGKKWDVEGLRQDKQSMTVESDTYLAVLGWVLSQQKIIIKNISAEIHFNDGTLLSFDDLNLTTLHSYGHYRIRGTARLLAQKKSTELSIIADMQLDPSHLNSANGQAYLSVKQVFPAKWQNFFPDIAYKIKDGEGNLEVWLDLDKGTIVSVRSLVNFNHVLWTQETQTQKHSLDHFSANLAWLKTKQGWRLTGDRLDLSLDGFAWPENTMQLDYKKSIDRYRAFVKALPVESLLATDIAWPDTIQSLLARKPQGDLLDTQVTIQAKKIDYVLTRFSNFGWVGKGNIPSVNNISGVLYWQPTEGHLELDGENTLITAKKMPPVAFDQLNAAFDWKQMVNGWRISMDRFVLERPDMVLSAQGTLDDPMTPNANLRVTAEYSAKDARHWLDYIPTRSLKPKLNAWLKQDIKRINQLTGRLRVNGPLIDFPFDKQPGDFVIEGYASGVDLIFAKNWPLTRDIDAYLQFNKRTLDVNVVNADLGGVIENKLSLVINDMGLGQEALLIHGDIRAPAEKIKRYLLASPLEDSLRRLKALKISDNLGLDLKLDIPLYPESDHIFAKGVVTFDDNHVAVDHAPHDIVVDKLSGLLQFNENGVTNGELQGSLDGDPIAIHMQAVRKEDAYLEVNVDTSTSIDFLQQTFDFPLLQQMKGHFNLHGLLKLNHDSEKMDHAKLSSDLKGVDINLPPPLEKTAGESVPASIDIDFSDQKNLEFSLAYRDLRVRASELAKNDWSFKILEKLLAADIRYQKENNMLSGTIDHLYLSNDLILNKRVRSAIDVNPADIPNLNLTIGDLKLDKVSLGKVNLKSNSSPGVWTLESCKIATPNYQMVVQGSWKQNASQNSTALDAELQLFDLGKALAAWDIIPAVDAHRGQVYFKGGWSSSIFNFSLDKLMGDMQITLKNGHITNLDKSTEEKLGLGKLLSILSLQTIPRRLSLDFSDLSTAGYSFDEFKGTFTIKHGVMNTQDSYIDGPVAYASMKGDLDLAKQLYDVDLRVSPYIMASLPIVVTIAGGPIAGPVAGIATWVASKIINKGMQQISAYTYKISGPWADPVVQQVKIYRKKKS